MIWVGNVAWACQQANFLNLIKKNFFYSFYGVLFAVTESKNILVTFDTRKKLQMVSMSILVAIQLIILKYRLLWIRLEIWILVTMILGFPYRASTQLRYQWFGNHLTNEPRIGTPICQSLLYCILVMYEDPLHRNKVVTLTLLKGEMTLKNEG